MNHLIYLSCDVGGGGGFIVGGAPMMGASGYAGEIGHQPFNPKGQTCRCGIVVPALGGDSVIVGAAELAFADLLQDPVGVLTGAAGDAGTVLDA
jgi:ROK family